MSSSSMNGLHVLAALVGEAQEYGGSCLLGWFGFWLQAEQQRGEGVSEAGVIQDRAMKWGRVFNL